MSFPVDNVELLRLTAPVLAETVDSCLKDRNAPRFAENHVFFETIRTQFRFLAKYLEHLAGVRSPADSWPQLKHPLENVTWKMSDAISPENLDESLSALVLESEILYQLEFPENLRDQALCRLYRGLHFAADSLQVDTHLKGNGHLIRNDISNRRKNSLMMRLVELNAYLRQFISTHRLDWHPKTVLAVRSRLSTFHEALCKSLPHQPRRGPTSYPSLRSCEDIKLRLDGTWCSSESETSGLSFQFLACGHRPTAFTQECGYTCHPETSSQQRQAAERRPEKIGDSMVNETVCLHFRMEADLVLSRIRGGPYLATQAPQNDAQTPPPQRQRRAMHTSDGPGELSLQRLLASTDICYREKAILAAILTHSLVPLLGTSWLAEDWSLDDVSLFCDEGQQNTPIINLRRPYITSNLELTRQRAARKENPSKNDVRVRDNELEHAFHHRPQLIRLAILLMELLLGDRAQQFYASAPRFKELRKSRRSAELLYTADKMKVECLRRYPPRHVFLVVVDKCLEHRPFARKPGELWYDDYTDPKILGYIYRRIVWPLEDELIQDLEYSKRPGSETPTLGDLQNQDVSDPLLSAEPPGSRVFSGLRFQSPRAPSSALLDLAADHPEPTGYELEDMDNAGTTDEDRKARTMWEDEWLREFRTMTNWLSENDDRHVNNSTRRLDVSNENNLIKIAVLDSGCDSQMQANLTSGKVAAGWRDFVQEGSVKWVDRSGHGTVVVGILLQIVKFAKIYVARVFDTKEADSGTARRVARAIEHAVDAWGVDIINMSFSLNGDPAIVENAIDYAASKRVLMFAAASNDKFNRPGGAIGFPACLGDRVICINAHNGSDGRCTFSPGGKPGRANFALPGQGIKTTGAGGTTVVKSGTSCATPIAVGIAALLLDYNTRLREAARSGALSYEEEGETVARIVGETWDGDRNRLRDIKIMKSIMLQLMTENKVISGGYNCVKPWILFNRARTHVKIITALQTRVAERNQDTIFH